MVYSNLGSHLLVSSAGLRSNRLLDLILNRRTKVASEDTPKSLHATYSLQHVGVERRNVHNNRAPVLILEIDRSGIDRHTDDQY